MFETSPLRRRGRRAPIRLQLPSGDQPPHGEARAAAGDGMQPSGIFVVLKFTKRMREGMWDADIQRANVTKAGSPLEAAQKIYMAGVDNLDSDDERDKADARFVVFDFYTGERFECLIESEWRANVTVAGKVTPPEQEG